ncbi:MAG: phosphoglycerate kinase [Candidatus Shapirobacteria bacterium]|jgi:phosphoglycerate kinase
MKINLSPVSEVDPNLRVLLRMDTDLPMDDGQILDNSRLVKTIPTIKLLLEKNCKIVIIGHRGRPEGKIAPEMSLKQIYLELMDLLENDGQSLVESVFVENFTDQEKIKQALETNQIVFLENLRFHPGEEANDPLFLKGLVDLCSVFVNDAFAVAHRKCASIMLHNTMPAFYGISFVEEAEKIAKLLDPERPLTIILGGAKKDKLDYLPELEKIADRILIGGKLPKLMQNPSPASRDLPLTEEAKVVVAKLREDGLDLSDEDIEKFKEIINSSNTVIWAGAMGFYESPESKKGTDEIASAIAEANAYKVIAGGDTSASVSNLGVREKIDYVCSGGGVMLEFLAKGTLPAWG